MERLPSSCNYPGAILYLTLAEINRQSEACNSDQQGEQLNVCHAITSRLLWKRECFRANCPIILQRIYDNTWDGGMSMARQEAIDKTQKAGTIDTAPTDVV